MYSVVSGHQGKEGSGDKKGDATNCAPVHVRFQRAVGVWRDLRVGPRVVVVGGDQELSAARHLQPGVSGGLQERQYKLGW